MNNDKTSYIKATFLEECPRRFLGRILIEGKEELVYIPSSSKLSHFIYIDGRDVIVERNKGTGRTKYTLVAVKIKNQYVYLNLNKVNFLLYKNICIETKHPIENIICEKRLYWGYRADVFIDELIPEIFEAKSVISEKDIVYFPQVFSERACKQLENLSQAINDQMKVYYCFMILSPNIKHIVIKDDTIFKKNFDACISRGMEARVYRIEYEGSFICKRDCTLETELIVNEKSHGLSFF